MKKVLIVFLFGLCLLTSCSDQKKIQIEIEPDSIVSIAISGYPTMFANGDSIDSTTDINKITSITSSFNKLTLTFYKTKEEWDKLSPASTKRQKDTITFYNAKKECVERITRVNNSEGTFIIKLLDQEVYTVSEEDYTKLNTIFDTLIEEAVDGRLNS